MNNIVLSKEKETYVYNKDLKSVAEHFNQFFTFVGRNVAVKAAKDNDIVLSNPLSDLITHSPDEQFNFRPVYCTHVQHIIMAMPSNKSPGPDKINVSVIKDCLPVILSPLAHSKLFPYPMQVP